MRQMLQDAGADGGKFHVDGRVISIGELVVILVVLIVFFDFGIRYLCEVVVV